MDLKKDLNRLKTDWKWTENGLKKDRKRTKIKPKMDRKGSKKSYQMDQKSLRWSNMWIHKLPPRGRETNFPGFYIDYLSAGGNLSEWRAWNPAPQFNGHFGFVSLSKLKGMADFHSSLIPPFFMKTDNFSIIGKMRRQMRNLTNEKYDFFFKKGEPG